jgi:transposase
VIQQFRIEHSPAGIERLITRCLALDPDPAEIRVVLETRHGLLVEALVDAGFTVVPVNPDLLARRRGPARKKDDAKDARICCLLALDRHTTLRQLTPHGEIAGELRAIARDDERAARDHVRLLNRLRADLQITSRPRWSWPVAISPVPTVLRLLQHWPTQPELAQDTREELVSFRPFQSPRLARALRRPGRRSPGHPRPCGPGPSGAGQDHRHPPAASQLLALHEARRSWEQRMAELLLGGPRAGRDRTVTDPDPGKAFPGGEIYLSMPGLGDRLAARVAGEIGDAIHQYETPNALQCYAAPPRSPADRTEATSSLPAASHTIITLVTRAPMGFL